MTLRHKSPNVKGNAYHRDGKRRREEKVKKERKKEEEKEEEQIELIRS